MLNNTGVISWPRNCCEKLSQKQDFPNSKLTYGKSVCVERPICD